jgi:hypothetical protein
MALGRKTQGQCAADTAAAAGDQYDETIHCLHL